MTQVYKCDICGGLSEFEHNIMIGNKQDHFGDICYNCVDLLKDFIKEEHEGFEKIESEPESQEVILDKAKALLKQNGFVYYKAPATRNRSKSKK